MSVARRAAALAAALALAGCGSNNAPAPTAAPPAAVTAPATPTSTPTSAPAQAAAPPAAPAAAVAGTFAFPYAAGVVAEAGSLGLHDDNFSYLDDRTTSAAAGTGYTLSGSGPATGTPPGVGDASLDLVVKQPGGPVIPLAAGTVLASSPYCQTVLVDHGGGTWVEYVHLVPSVAAGQHVDRSTQLGTVAPALGAGVTGPCGLKSDAPHVHFAFLKGSESTSQYVSMLGVLLCGHAVTSSGGIDGLATGPGQWFTVPSCPGDAAPPTAPAMTGTWVAPKDGAKLTTSTLTLSAKATVTPTTLSVTKVAFSVTWGSTAKAACSATRAGSGGVWSCQADLWKLGAPLGRLTLSFDVTDSAGDVAKAPAGTRTVTFAAAPGSPGNVAFDPHCEMNVNCGDPISATVTWNAAAGVVTGYRVYWSTVNDVCAKTMTYSNTLVGTVGAGARSWSGKVAINMGRFVVVAYNGAGSGRGGISGMLGMDFVCGP